VIRSARRRRLPPLAAACASAGLFAAAGLSGCTGGTSPLACAVDGDCASGNVCERGDCVARPVTCPSLQPTFASINSGLLQGCGAKTSGCHDAASAAQSHLDLATDPFHALLGHDGKGAPAAAVAGRPALLEVSPGDAAGSFLVQKLKIYDTTPELGAAMPPAAPRSVCPDAIATVSAWIAQGAKGP
jgi:hypothetical protein